VGLDSIQDGILRADWKSAQIGPINNRPAGCQTLLSKLDTFGEPPYTKHWT
jgi:hypothetical protein